MNTSVHESMRAGGAMDYEIHLGIVKKNILRLCHHSTFWLITYESIKVNRHLEWDTCQTAVSCEGRSGPIPASSWPGNLCGRSSRSNYGDSGEVTFVMSFSSWNLQRMCEFSQNTSGSHVLIPVPTLSSQILFLT